ncbi:putative lipoprotein [Vibrio ishigakensis]|uniref:Putative lipoprotein n=1 Tax=Vibrio ishigakensis TaxID=1481914 RepID=A0A0B8P999_9VIBR|nr:putative lipoprotein [Vibrio ishigakensis]
MKLLKTVLVGGALLSLTACSQLHHVQISDIDQSQGALTPISIRVNELGFDAAETAQIASDLARSEKDSENLQAVATILALMNMGRLRVTLFTTTLTLTKSCSK